MSTGRRDGRKRLRVLHVAQSVAGGVASVLEELSAYQSARYGADNVRFVVPQGSEVYLDAINLGRLICFRSSRRSAGSLLDFARVAMAAVRNFKPDVVHLHSSFAGAIVRVCLMGKKDAPRVVYCPHGWAFGKETSRARKRIYAAIERLLARRTDVILLNSDHERALGVDYGVPTPKMQVVKNGIAWMPAPSLRPKEGPIRVAFVGRHDRQKGLDLLLNTLSRSSLRDLRVEIIGEQVLGDCPVQDRDFGAEISFVGWLSRRQIAARLAAVDAVVMPSRWEAFGLVAAEAMRSGVPVIASNRGALPEVVQHGEGGYIFDLDDPDALGRLLASLTRDELQILGASARRRWEREFVAERMNELTIAAYDRALAERGRSRHSAEPSESERPAGFATPPAAASACAPR